MAEPSLFARVLGEAAYEFSLMQPMIPTYIHLLVSALFPIYTGAHASLSRPSSAAKRTKRRKVDEGDDDGSDDEEDEEETHKMEGLSPTDAIMMPLLAGTTLAGLYFLIKWLKDPAILNKFLNAYFALFGIFSVAKLITDALDIGHSIIFPRRYTLGGALYHVHGKEKKAKPVAGNIKDKPIVLSPLPGFLTRISLSDGMRELLWSDRAMPANKWTLRMYLHRVFAGKVRVGTHGFVGFVLSSAAVAYFNFVDKPWYLTNLMGFGFSYGALQLMSPTTFATGSLILGALFFYDIYFVFYTPMMVTVAKTLDVPIKLVFPRPASPDSTSTEPSLAMLGLGDVVLPGIMMGLALRFDLFLFYLRRQKRTPAVEQGEGVVGEAIVVKPEYFSLAGRWSDHFWTHSLTGRPLYSTSNDSKAEPPFTFPKTYFKASLVGYILGMLATLGVMHVWGHAQPALLYLVPGVLGSLWLTALFKGELSLMWDFSEAVEDEDEDDESPDKEADDKEPKQAPERTSFFSLSEKKSLDREARMEKMLRKHVTTGRESEDDGNPSKKDKVKEAAGHKPEREVFSFSIEAPWTLKHPRSIRKSSRDDKEPEPEESPLEKGKPNWAPPVSEEKAVEPAGKRIRLK
ncbi:intramembrane protease 2 [Melanomma pulvis-pyrius CBS 109.77]|uniref:Intramembrane protease 2 n=1 Tax=Melanomma pulvis-pyrius CBS 109.77 TaxID=1314802 RepID=A0A6A6XTM2_9PLEO|nr:intramembrane protease 2 [Melanomma pulvis-pyrius CBS 109.77]